ncbi:DNA-binding transcriptional regulator [Sulfitobacter pseudonitzschiae]|uniref:DNA-binding transcriptional regulator n=1 Tax=Pseudosulfitobacter pseudonitzschiae TaxID=1402135 RepID=A0A9Q2RXX8_9RHOB|nr:DNA-binding transcriptional regulator [Pseudosulfitobacter pseudonitzschiae]MBM2294981.1 DNA-binding transcriptional regulator [Pseudosulfitobacter pseudonitzschiae]MBM2299896.1 DNA-binding transcriptional regulator [Pseudosulfitobacter pseudonitzschiae]MBM2304819.1 DNA-binding transcriptional regulator [Pseudosulfitobacter pseudonitzschiae]MBM2314592.1 DNA-binding transcriptional regulator [Pseudosulfitobacter pseudonitzschiae]MBM2319502.1 DNA-binding transcriptional regulator [Pseudosulfi
MTDFPKTVRSVERTLQILELMNRAPVVRVRYLAAETDIPAPTVVRLLETLIAAGYVRKIGRQAGYCVTGKVAALGAGHHGLPQVFNFARQTAEALTKHTLWPTALATLDVDALVIRFSTIPMSPLSHYQSTINRRMTLLDYAHGRAYLGFCPEEERQHLVALLQKSAADEDEADAIAQRAEAVVALTRASGFGERTGNIQPETHSVAVPLRMGTKLVGTLGITYFAKAQVHVTGLKAELKAAAEACTAGRAYQPVGTSSG